MRTRRIIGIIGSLIFALSVNHVQAAIPPHVPGTICATPAFWCPAVVAGSVGAPCYCSTVSGAVAGVYV